MRQMSLFWTSFINKDFPFIGIVKLEKWVENDLTSPVDI